MTFEGVQFEVVPPGLLAHEIDPNGEWPILQSVHVPANGSFIVLVTNGRLI